ncbi:helix-turn-helix domain-containing protein [Zavarzinia compransoris]|uniref:HTH luxR-type domain-containing protein n=1 Tax=Zavarzinia compransoris TaxID=1264899 RepID=A0A317DUK5_9PROT|nr:helix-turn-helix transcriptional regulator [Zavarzinia compransoris]PWR18359.1 hypothetical protein DKG75_20565 [Zavarzinia compransoris]
MTDTDKPDRSRSSTSHKDELGTPLAPREIQCLQLIAQGKTDDVIAGLFSISRKTVNWYVERAKRRLGATTRGQALIEALKRGYIHLHDGPDVQAQNKNPSSAD